MIVSEHFTETQRLTPEKTEVAGGKKKPSILTGRNLEQDQADMGDPLMAGESMCPQCLQSK